MAARHGRQRGLSLVAAMRVACIVAAGGVAGACHTVHAVARGPLFADQTYLAASHNFAFRRAYPAVDRLFNAFDYGHAIIYERLVERRPPPDVERADFAYVTRGLLPHPPPVTLDEAAVGPAYVRLVPEVRATFEWAHMLHRQLYDVWADDRIPVAEKDARVAAVVRYYRSRPDLALSARPKSMVLMDGRPYSGAFRSAYPRFSGLLWSYHWLQMAVYDALIAGRGPEERQAHASAVVARFWAFVADAPARMPTVMPMSAAVAPAFSARYPEAAAIFDNLHALHDVVADILASPVVPVSQKRAALLAATAAYRDDVTAVTSRAEWEAMAVGMGVEQMGGTARQAFAPTPPRDR